MGSLMAGWRTQPSDANQALKRTMSSMTKQDIENFWRTKQSSIRRHLRQAHKDAIFRRSLTIPEDIDAGSEDCITFEDSDAVSESALTPTSVIPKENEEKIDWWTKSRWAFLNEPPVSGTKHDRYTAQFHIESNRDNNPDLSSTQNSRRSVPAV